jgi:hypothetical protein
VDQKSQCASWSPIGRTRVVGTPASETGVVGACTYLTASVCAWRREIADAAKRIIFRFENTKFYKKKPSRQGLVTRRRTSILSSECFKHFLQSRFGPLISPPI